MNESPRSLELLVPQFTKREGGVSRRPPRPPGEDCLRLVITYGADPRATGSPFHLAQSRWHGSLPRLGRSSPGTTVPRGEEEKFGASGRSRQQTGASGCSLAVGRAAKQGNRAPRAPPRDALPGPRPAHPTPFPGRARSQRPLSETAGAASEKKAGRTLHPGPWASGFPSDLGSAAWLPLPGRRAARIGGTSQERSAAGGHGPARLRRA